MFTKRKILKNFIKIIKIINIKKIIFSSINRGENIYLCNFSSVLKYKNKIILHFYTLSFGITIQYKVHFLKCWG